MGWPIYRCSYCKREWFYQPDYQNHENFTSYIEDDADQIIMRLERNIEHEIVSAQNDKLDCLYHRMDISTKTKEAVKQYIGNKYALLNEVFDEEMVEMFDTYVIDRDTLYNFTVDKNLKDKEFSVAYARNYSLKAKTRNENTKDIIIKIDNEWYLINKRFSIELK
jgi:hypothetical protein